MKFEEALKLLKDGKKIRKRYWCKDNYVYINSNGELVNQGNKPFAMFLYGLSNFEEDIWEIIEEPKKIKLRDMTYEQYEKWQKNNCAITLCEDCPFFKVRCYVKSNRCWANNKELYSDKFLDQEIEIEDDPILTDEEREYLSAVIKPFRDNVKSIEKIGSEYFDSDNDFIVVHLVEDSISLPILNTSFKFNGMELNKQYTLKELRL